MLALPANEGFWVRGRGPARVWVQLIGHGESPQHVRPGDKVTFHGALVINTRHFAAHAGLDADDGSGLLTREGAHISVRYHALRITHQTR